MRCILSLIYIRCSSDVHSRRDSIFVYYSINTRRLQLTWTRFYFRNDVQRVGHKYDTILYLFAPISFIYSLLVRETTSNYLCSRSQASSFLRLFHIRAFSECVISSCLDKDVQYIYSECHFGVLYDGYNLAWLEIFVYVHMYLYIKLYRSFRFRWCFLLLYYYIYI